MERIKHTTIMNILSNMPEGTYFTTRKGITRHWRNLPVRFQFRKWKASRVEEDELIESFIKHGRNL